MKILLYICKLNNTNSYMTQMNTYKKSASQVPVVRIGGGISVKYNHNNLLRIPLMLCLLCVGAAFFVS